MCTIAVFGSQIVAFNFLEEIVSAMRITKVSVFSKKLSLVIFIEKFAVIMLGTNSTKVFSQLKSIYSVRYVRKYNNIRQAT